MADNSAIEMTVEEQLLQIPVSPLETDSQSIDNESSQIESNLSNDVEDEESYSIANIEAKERIVSVEESYSDYYIKQKFTSPILTKFERAKLLGVRAEMISAGNPPMIIVPKNIDNAYEIALLELNEKKIPLMVRRYLPDGSIEDWRIEELIIKAL